MKPSKDRMSKSGRARCQELREEQLLAKSRPVEEPSQERWDEGKLCSAKSHRPVEAACGHPCLSEGDVQEMTREMATADARVVERWQFPWSPA